MRPELLDILVCPNCRTALECAVAARGVAGEITEGELRCSACSAAYPVLRGIPRFAGDSTYADSFGYQWNQFRKVQLDSASGKGISAKRFFSETGWSSRWLRQKRVLDAGCGAGRFLEIAASQGCEVIGVDLSNAVDAAAAAVAGMNNAHVVQASLFALPFRPETFDACYCIGVLQHTPDFRQAIRGIASRLRPGAELAVTAYERKPWTLLHVKYWLRPLTKRVSPPRLLRALRLAMPFLFATSEVLFRIPVLKHLFVRLVPVTNYVQLRELTRRDRYTWAMLDTFDMLSPQYDLPISEVELRAELAHQGIADVTRVSQRGLNLKGKKVSSRPSPVGNREPDSVAVPQGEPN